MIYTPDLRSWRWSDVIDDVPSLPWSNISTVGPQDSVWSIVFALAHLSPACKSTGTGQSWRTLAWSLRTLPSLNFRCWNTTIFGLENVSYLCPFIRKRENEGSPKVPSVGGQSLLPFVTTDIYKVFIVAVRNLRSLSWRHLWYHFLWLGLDESMSVYEPRSSQRFERMCCLNFCAVGCFC